MVSVIVPCYNAEQYLSRCIDSILHQTDHDIELIIVNDGSSDQSEQIVISKSKEAEQTLSHFVYLKQQNQGVGGACSTAFGVASGDYLMLLDADDRLLPEAVEKCRSFLDSNPSYALVRTNGYYVNEENPDASRSLMELNDINKKKDDIFEDLLIGQAYGWAGTYMIRMSVLDCIYPDRKIYPSRSGQNLQFIMMAAYRNRAGFIDLPLMEYFTHQDSLSHFASGNVLERELKAMRGYESIRRYLIDNMLPQEEREELHQKVDQMILVYQMRLAARYSDKTLMENSYRQIPDPTLDQMIMYHRLMHPGKSIFLRGIRKSVRILNRFAGK